MYLKVRINLRELKQLVQIQYLESGRAKETERRK